MKTKPVTPTRRPHRFIWPPHPNPDHSGHPTRTGRRVRRPLTPPFVVGGNGAGVTYRLARTDTRNIALQRLTAGRWKSVAYCGNNTRAIIRTVGELAVKHWQPGEAADLAGQLAQLRRAVDRLEEAVKNI